MDEGGLVAILADRAGHGRSVQRFGGRRHVQPGEVGAFGFLVLQHRDAFGDVGLHELVVAVDVGQDLIVVIFSIDLDNFGYVCLV